ncbi:MAG TPA: hypothetical protein VK279_03750, partial [Solirubrobacteraceae bacterium]|nr:hypothetical protein [Solirubrobacteraceae bacterium]
MRAQPPQVPPGAPARRGGGRTPVAAPVAVRLAAASALALFGAAHWAALVRPGAGGFAVGAVAVAGGAALAGLLVPRPGARIPPRAVRTAIALAAAFLLGLLAGVPATALAPTGWGTLVSAVADALGTLPGLRVPYAGGDPWVRAVILAGAGGLIAVGLLGAAWRRRRSRALAAAALSVLYLVPAVQLSVGAPFLRGGAFLLLLVGLLYGERVAARPRDVAPAIVLATAVALLAVLVAPVLDADEPWLNYRALASDLADEGGARSFSWDHGYGRLDWPRDGRVVLRVRARTSAYWKAANLDGFDGRRWVQAGLFADAKPRSQLPGVGESRARWSESVRVTVGDLRTSQVVGAGTTLALTSLRLRPIAVGSPGSFAVTGELHGGDSYVARVYVPRPRPAELSGASLSYPPFTAAHRIVRMPRIDRRGRRLPGSGDARAAGSRIVVPAWNSPRPLRALTPLGRVIDGDAIIRNSPYRRTWALAERLRRGSRTPYEYVRRVEEHLAR